MAKVRIKGDTSGYYDLTVPSIAGDNTLSMADLATYVNMVSGDDLSVTGDVSAVDVTATGTLTAGGLVYPTSDGTSGQFIKTDGSGNLSFASVATGYRNGEVIEDLFTVCDGGTLPGNTATVQNVTGVQNLTTSYNDVTGSVVSDYVVPSGTKTVVYTFEFQFSRQDSTPITHFKLYYKVGSGSWTEASHGARSLAANAGQWRQTFAWPFTVGAATAYTNDGILTESTPTLSFKWQAREYSSSYEGKLHVTDQFDGAGTDKYSRPLVGVKAIAGS